VAAKGRIWAEIGVLQLALWGLGFLLCFSPLKGEQYSTYAPHPIGFSIPETKIVKKIPLKDQDFACVIPGKLQTYIFEREADYYQDYQRSYYAITCKKGGWDCLRHYEILANGCIPYFLDLDDCDEGTLYFFPKELVKEAMHLEGVSFLNIDHRKFDRQKYNEILEKLLDHTRRYLTCRDMANYLLETLHYSGIGKVLFLSGEPNPDYLRDLTLIGLKEILQDKLVDLPQIPYIYKSYQGDIAALYGKGMTYTKIIDDLSVDREDIEQRIHRREFEFIIYGSIHRGLPHLELVTQKYPPSKIAYLCGEDRHECYLEDGHQCHFIHLRNLFLREFENYCGNHQ
jgi:hypothetical protein